MRRLGMGLIAAALLAGCGSSTTVTVATNTLYSSLPQSTTTPAAGTGKRFAVSGIAVHFRYPADFKVGTVGSIASSSGAPSQARAEVGLDNSNLIAVLSYPNSGVPVTPQNVGGVKSRLDTILSKAVGRPIVSTQSTVHGMILLQFPAIAAQTPQGRGEDKTYYTFVGHVAYELLCQWLPGHQAPMLAACREMISTLSS